MLCCSPGAFGPGDRQASDGVVALAAERILGLQRQVRQLRSLLPICAYCHRIRGEGDRWESMERVLEQRTGSELSHGICPDCVGQQAGDRDPFKAGGANERPGCGKGSGARAGADID